MKIKKLIAILLTLVLVAGAAAGIGFAVKKSTAQSVMVVPASELNYGGGWGGGMNSMEGVITSDATQDIYLYDTQTVEQVMVGEGQEVSEGDLLMVFDTEKTNLNLEMEKLQHDLLKLRVDTAEQNLKTLASLTPYVEPSYDPYDDGGGDEPGEDEEEPKREALSVLNGESLAWNENTGTEDFPVGSEFNPYRYLCKEGTVIEASFIEMLRAKAASGTDTFFLLEVREGDAVDGTLKKSWMQNAKDLEAPGEGWTGTVSLAGETPIPGPTPEEQIEELKKTVAEKEKAVEELKAKIKEMEESEAATDEETKKQIEELKAKIAELEQIIEDLSGGGEEGGGEGGGEEGGGESGGEGGGSGSGDSEGGGSEGGGTGDATADHPFGIPVADISVYRPDGTETAEFATLLPNTTVRSVTTLGAGGLIPPNAQMTKEEIAAEKSATEEELKGLRLDLRESELKIKATEKSLGEGEVRAVMNGIVKSVGDPANPPKDGSPFLQIAGSAGLYVRGGLNELYLDQLNIGDTVMVTSYMDGGMYEAEVKDISPYPDTSGMFGWGGNDVTYYPFTVLISDPSAQIANGNWVEISLMTDGMSDETAEQMEQNSLYLWKAFIREDEGGKYVFVRGEDERLEKRYIKVGELSGEGYEIKDGIGWEDWIAFPYGKEVKEGAKTREGSVSELAGY